MWDDPSRSDADGDGDGDGNHRPGASVPDRSSVPLIAIEPEPETGLLTGCDAIHGAREAENRTHADSDIHPEMGTGIEKKPPSIQPSSSMQPRPWTARRVVLVAACVVNWTDVGVGRTMTDNGTASDTQKASRDPRERPQQDDQSGRQCQNAMPIVGLECAAARPKPRATPRLVTTLKQQTHVSDVERGLNASWSISASQPMPGRA
ncbi:hypothetical protein AcV5_004050 [Taiwanofungus camphoratus]|nr:hypothetical protein AcV5_004050 [Antrodia cinnamomea]